MGGSREEPWFDRTQMMNRSLACGILVGWMECVLEEAEFFDEWPEARAAYDELQALRAVYAEIQRRVGVVATARRGRGVAARCSS